MAIDNNDFTHEFQIYSTDKNAGTIGTGEFMLFDNNINALTIKDISNIKINGGEEGQILTTDGEGNLTWITSAGGGGVQVNADWNSSSGASRILNKPDLTAYLPKSGGTLTGKLNAAQGAGTAGGYSFGGTEGGNDSGMFSNADGVVDFYANNVKVVTVTSNGVTSTQAITLPGNPTSNLQAATKQYVDSSISALNNFSGNYNDLTNKPTVATGAYIGTTQVAFNRASGLLTLTGVNIDGNAATVSNGVYTTGTYANPAWITSLAYSKLTDAPTLATVATTGAYTDLTNKPSLAAVATSGSYSDLTNRPTIFSGAYADLTGKPTLFDGAYLSLTGAPNLAVVATSGSYNDLSNKPSIPDLTGYATESWVQSQGYGSGSGGNPFDQSLNTDDIVTFDLLTVTDSAGIKNFNGERITNTYVNGKMYVGGSMTQTPVSILIGGAGPRNEWAFTPDGNLTLPAGGDIKDSNGNSVLGGGGVSLPANASGYLTNDGAGNLSWAAGDGTFSGDYNDLTNKPIPSLANQSGKYLTNDGSTVSWANPFTDPAFQWTGGGGSTLLDQPENNYVALITDTSDTSPTFKFRYDGVFQVPGQIYDNNGTPVIDRESKFEYKQSTDFTAAINKRYIVRTETNPVTVTLPSTETLAGGEAIFFADAYNTFSAENPLIITGGNIGDSNSDTYVMDTPASYIGVFNTGNGRWRIYAQGPVTSSGSANTGDVTFSGSTISTANTNQDLTITTNGTGDIYIGADRDMIFDMNAFAGKGIVLQDSSEDGYDDPAIPSTLYVGRIYHDAGKMIIKSDGRIAQASDPTNLVQTYGGLWLTNGVSSGIEIPAPVIPGPEDQFQNYSLTITNDGTQWNFTREGKIQLPAGGDIVDSTGTSVLGGGTAPTNEITNTDGNNTYSVSVSTTGIVTMNTARGSLEFGAQPEPGGPSHFHIMRPASENGSGGTDLYFGDDYNYVLQRPAAYGQAPAYGVEIGTNDNDGGAQQVWRFGTDGHLTLPAGGDIKDSSGNSVLGGGSANLGHLSVTEDNVVQSSDSAAYINFDADSGNNILAIGTNDGAHIKLSTDGGESNFEFVAANGTGSITFPDGTVQTTAATGGGNSLAPELTKSGGNLVASTTLEFQGNIYGAIFDVDSGGNFDVWFQSVTGDSDGTSYAIGSNDDGYNFVYAFSASGTVAWKVGLDDILGNDNTAYGIKYKSGYLYLSCQYYNSDVGENQVSVLKLNANDGTVNSSWVLTNSSSVQYRPRDIAVSNSGDPIVIGESWNETQTFSGLTPQAGSGSQVLVINGSDLNNAVQTNPWGSYYIHTDPNDPSAWYSVQGVNHFFNVPTVVVTGGGDGGMTLDIRYMYYAGTGWRFDWVTITNGGSGYNLGDQVKVLGSSIGGADGVDDIILSSNGWYMNVLSVGGVATDICPTFVSDKVRFTTSQNVDFSTGIWDVRIGLGSQAFVWTPNWQHSYGDTGSQEFMSVSVDSSDNIYLLGDFEYYDGSNYHNVLAMKLNSSGVQQWTKFIEDNTYNSQDPGTITVDSSGNSYIINQNNNSYTLVTKLDSVGDLVWQVRQTDNNNWNNYCVGGVDSNGDVIVMGSWYGNNNNNYVTNIHKLSGTDGSLVWSRDFGNQQNYDMYEYYDEDGQAGHVVGDSFYYGGYCYDSNDNRDVGFGFRLPADGTGTGTYGRYVYSTNNDTQYEDNTSNAVLTDYTYNAIDSVSLTYVETSASTTADAVGNTTSNHWFIGTGGGLTGVDSITFSDGTVLTTAEAGGGGWTPGNDIVQTVDTQLRIVVKDPNENYYRLDLAVEDDNGNVKTRMDMDYNRVQIEANNGQRQWQFDSNGEFRIPGTISTFDNDINIVAMNAGNAGNITIKTVANYNNVHFSSIDITQNGVNITTDMDNTPGGKTFEFRDSGILVLPQGSDIQNASGVSVLGTEPKFTLNYQSFNAVSGNRYCIDSLGQAVTATLPTDPAMGDAIYFVDAFGTFNTNNLTIDGNGKNIMGASTQVITTANESIGVFYNGAEWRFYG